MSNTERAFGVLCNYHFDKEPAALKIECDNCLGCFVARKAETDHIQQNYTIDPSQPYGQHIALRCVKHPNLRWSTKNIDYIGARSIFFAPGSGTECDCSIALLEVVNHDQ